MTRPLLLLRGLISFIAHATTTSYGRAGALGVGVSVLVLAGCGYHLAGNSIRPPEGIRSVSIGVIENKSREFGLDKAITFALEREIHRRGILRIEEDPAAGEAILTGTIRRFATRPVAFAEEDEALQYEAELVVDLTLRRQSDGKILWRAVGMHEVDDYSVASRIVVPSTSQFQRGVTSVDDLRRLTDIQLAETEKRLAVERLVGALARDVHDRILEDF